MDKHSSHREEVLRRELNEILLTATRRDREAMNQPPAKSVVTLKEMLDRYMFVLGYENAHLLEVLIALMTRGKICVEFRAYTERLELNDPARMMNQPGTIQLFNDYLASVKANKKVGLANRRTQRITVQMPKFMGPPAGQPREPDE